MIEYNVIGECNFKSKKFELLVDGNYKYFFLEITPSGERFVDYRDYISLATIFTKRKFALNAEKDKKDKGKKKKLIPSILYKGVAIVLGASIISSLAGCTKLNPSLYGHYDSFYDDTPYSYSDTMSYDETPQDDYYYEDGKSTQDVINEMMEDIREEEEDFHIEIKENLWDLTMVYDASALDEVLGYPKSSVTYDTIRDTIRNNPNIPAKFKSLYLLLADNLQKQYPDMDLRIWFENLKTIKIHEVDQMDMYLKAFSTDAYACYRLDENAIYTVKDYDYVPGTWEYQVIMHEFGHPIRSANFIKDGQEIRIQFESTSGFGSIVGESLNSLLTLRSYDKDEKDVAYQFQSNMIELMLDSMINYSLQDFVEHNVTYFEQKLNETNGNTDAIRMLGLMDLQYRDYHSDEINVSQDQFYPLYDYIADMFYNRYITPSTSYDQARIIHDTFVSRLTFDVPKEYNVDINHLNEHFKEYCQQKGITASKTAFNLIDEDKLNTSQLNSPQEDNDYGTYS